MTTVALTAARVLRLPGWLVLGLPALVAGIGLRAARAQAGLIYPDGYQYLLMARGIAEHGQPVTQLGPGGDLFVPNVDAAVKPLYPLLVAGLELAGADPRAAAQAVAAVAGGAVVALCALLTLRLSALLGLRLGGSVAGGAAAGVIALLAPSLGHWSGFAGPDPLAQALVLGAALAACCRRPVVAGLLAGAAVCARPEVALLVAVLGLAALASRALRADAQAALAAAAGTTAAVHLAVRSPFPLPDARVVALGAGTAFVGAVAVAAVWRWPSVGIALAVAGLTSFLALRAPVALERSDGWLLAAGGVAALSLAHDPRAARIGALILLVASPLAVAYVTKNPTSDRYLANLLPAACLLVGLAAAVRGPRLRLVAVPALAVGALLAPHPAPTGPDAFAATAARLDPSGPPLVTAAPDAYGFLLPDRSVRDLVPGARGLVLLDAAQRAYVPSATARGRTLRLLPGTGFVRWNGVVDDAPARLVRGVVAARP